MPIVHFTPNLRRHVDCPSCDVAGSTVREALDAVFSDNPLLRSYVVDDQSRLRQHMVIFLDGQAIHDRVGLSDPVVATSEIYVMQALSGG
jgi:hypothetical protein